MIWFEIEALQGVKVVDWGCEKWYDCFWSNTPLNRAEWCESTSATSTKVMEIWRIDCICSSFKFFVIILLELYQFHQTKREYKQNWKRSNKLLPLFCNLLEECLMDEVSLHWYNMLLIVFLKQFSLFPYLRLERL